MIRTRLKGQTPAHTRAMFLSACASVLLLSACASGPEMRLGSEPDEPIDGPDVHSAAYGADGFTYRKMQRVRHPNDFEFYFKHCELSDQRTHFSKTSYWCSTP